MKRKEGAFVVAQAAIFVGVIALIALPAQSINQMQVETTSTSSGGQLAFTSGVSPQGLQLRVMLNSSGIRSHGVLLASVEVHNTVNRNVSFSGVSENQNISEWNYDDYLCPASFLLGYAVFQGHFAAGNISSAGPPLRVVPESVVLCPSSPISGAVTFLPGGDRAVVGSGAFAYQATLQLNATTKYINCNELAGGGGEFHGGASPGLVGYWNYSVPAADDMNFTSPGFVYFPPGEYTIAAADDWNQYVYAAFVGRAVTAGYYVRLRSNTRWAPTRAYAERHHHEFRRGNHGANEGGEHVGPKRHSLGRSESEPHNLEQLHQRLPPGLLHGLRCLPRALHGGKHLLCGTAFGDGPWRHGNDMPPFSISSSKSPVKQSDYFPTWTSPTD